MAACCLSLIAFTPLSVSMSIKTSLLLSRKVLFPASVIDFRRSSIGSKFNFCTIRTLCISRGICSPLKNLIFDIILFLHYHYFLNLVLVIYNNSQIPCFINSFKNIIKIPSFLLQKGRDYLRVTTLIYLYLTI